MPAPTDLPTRLVLGVLFLPVFFPYVGVLKGIDMQPNAFLAMCMMAVVAMSQMRVYLDRSWSIVLTLTLLFVIFRFLVQQLSGDMPTDPGLGLVSFAQTVFHLLTMFVVFLIVSAGVFRPTSRYIGGVLLIYGLVAALQVFIDESIGSALVYRGFQELASTGRGVRSLASEPAVFANILLILSGFLMICAAQANWSRRSFLLSQALVLAMSIGLAQSTYVILLQFSVFCVCALLVSKRLFAIVGISAVWALFAYELASDTAGIRILYILQTLVENPVLLYEQGAMLRVMNVPISVYGSILHGPLGAGFDPQHMVVGAVPALPGHPYPFTVADRNMGGLVEILLRIGVGALPLLLLFLAGVGRIASTTARIGDTRLRIGMPVALVVFLTCFTYSSIGNPMIWLLFFSALQWSSGIRGDTASPAETWPRDRRGALDTMQASA